jgi:hypothetical protein
LKKLAKFIFLGKCMFSREIHLGIGLCYIRLKITKRAAVQSLHCDFGKKQS